MLKSRWLPTPTKAKVNFTAMHEITSAARPEPRIRLNREFVWSHRWIPSAVASASWLIFLATLFWRKSSLTILLSAGVALICSYAWGYSERAISNTEEVLEIGCGVGRVGRVLAAHCKNWTGCDISGNMVSFATERLQGILNTRLVTLRGVGLSELETASFDVVFATNMLGHLDEIDRWRYVVEAFRVPAARRQTVDRQYRFGVGRRMENVRQRCAQSRQHGTSRTCRDTRRRRSLFLM